MYAPSNPFRWGYLLLWLLGAFMGVVGGFFVFYVVMSALGESGGGPVPVLATSLVLTGCFGTIVGLAQWSILRLYVHRSAAWIGFTLVGFLISSPVIISQSGGFGPVIPASSIFYMTVTLGGVLGVAQWYAIHKQANRSTLWVGISLACWMMAGWVGIALKPLSWQMWPLFYWLGMFFAAVLLTAFGMRLFFKMRATPGFSEKNLPDKPLWMRVLRFPGTHSGWWAVALAATYLVFYLIFVTLPRNIASVQAAAFLIGMARPLLAWGAGIAGLTAVVERRERSILVWIAMLPVVYFLTRMLFIALR